MDREVHLRNRGDVGVDLLSGEGQLLGVATLLLAVVASGLDEHPAGADGRVVERHAVLEFVHESHAEIDDVGRREELAAGFPLLFGEVPDEVHVRLAEHVRRDAVAVEVVLVQVFDELPEAVVVEGVGVDVVGAKEALQFGIFLGKGVEGLVQGLIDVVVDGAEVVPEIALGNDRDVVEVLAAGELLAVLFDVCLVLFLELVGDGLVVDEREDVLLVVGGVNGVADDVGAFEEVGIEVFQREGHGRLN